MSEPSCLPADPPRTVLAVKTSWRSRLHAKAIPLVVAGTFFMQLMDTSILNTSLPQMAHSFGVRPLDMSVGVSIYMLVFAAMLPLSGWLAERFGARNVFLFAVVLFTSSSLVCGTSQSLWGFVVARAIQGIGASMMTPVGRVIVLRSTDKATLLEAIATITWPSLSAPLIGPLLGGFLTTWASWRWNFWINVPLGMVCFGLIWRFIPRFEGQRGRRFDFLGFALSSTSLAAFLHGFETLVHAGSTWIAWGSIAWGVVGGVAAVRHFGRVEHPLLDLSPLRVATFRLSSLTGGMWIRVAISSTPFLLPLLFQVGLGMTPLAAGGYLSSYFAGNLAMKSLTTKTLRRHGFRPVVVWNAVAVAASLALMVVIGRGMPVVLVGGLLFAAGLVRSMQFTCLSSLSFADVPKALSAPASTLSSMANQVAMALGVTLAAGLLNGSRVAGGREALELVDFRVAFGAMALLAMVAAWKFRALHANAGAEITGHA